MIGELEEELELKADASRAEVLAALREAMLAAARNLEFEKAALLRDRMLEIEPGSSAAKKEAAGARPFRPKSGTRGGNPRNRSRRR